MGGGSINVYAKVLLRSGALVVRGKGKEVTSFSGIVRIGRNNSRSLLLDVVMRTSAVS
jgi:hypothetical protein